MAWTTPRTWASGYVVLAADLNTHLRDNLNVTAPAVMTTAGDILYASGANTPARLAKSTTSTQYLANTGTSNVPAWNEVALDTGVSGTLPVGNGGTGATTFTANGILVGNSTSAVAVTATMATKGHVMIGDGSGVPSMLAVGSNDQVLTADSGEGTGVKWATPGGSAGLVFIATVVASNDASLTLTGITSTYDTYLWTASQIVPASNDVDMYARCGAGSIDSGSGNYEWHLQYSRTSVSTYEAVNSASSTFMQVGGNTAIGGLGNASGEGAGFAIWIHAPTDGTMKVGFSGSHVMVNGSGTPAGGPFYGFRDAVISIDRVQILMQSGNIATGRMSLWGLSHA